MCTKIIIENKQATGIEFEANGKTQTITANREVILSASSINSPKLLMLSGIGEAKQLKKHGIDVVSNRPGVGENLQDHLELYVQQKCTQPISLYSSLNLFSKSAYRAAMVAF